MPLDVAQVAIDAQGALGAALEGVEVLVARERPSLFVEALDEPVEELAHQRNVARFAAGRQPFSRARGAACLQSAR